MLRSVFPVSARWRETPRMGFDQVSLFLYPPQWERWSVADPTGLNYGGEPVQVVSAARTADSNSPVVWLVDVCRWFVARGFAVVAEGPEHARLTSRALSSALGQRAEIEISVGAERGEVTCFYCRFLLTRDTPVRLERWEALVSDLCGAFGLRIGVADGQAVDPEEFLAMVRRAGNWRYFAEHFGWVSPAEDDLA
jgi:hypothetical protein